MAKYLVSFRVGAQKFEWHFEYPAKFDPEKAEVYVFGAIKDCLEKAGVHLPTYAENIVVLLEDAKEGDLFEYTNGKFNKLK